VCNLKNLYNKNMSIQSSHIITKETNQKTLEIIRPELNLEKWPLWVPAKSKTKKLETRVFKREFSAPDGSKITAIVEMNPTTRGLLTTEDRKTYYGLVKIWEEKGRSTKEVFLSLRHLAAVLKKKWGTNVIETLTESLLRLRATPFIWKNSYNDAVTGKVINKIEPFNILGDLKIWSVKEGDKKVNKAAGYFKFNNHILENLLNNHTKPLFLDIILKLKSEIAQLLYTRLDLVMANKTHYERKSEGLFKDMELRGKAYYNLSNRKQKLQPVIKELHGVELSTGILTQAEIQPTKDKNDKDFKIIFRKRPSRLLSKREDSKISVKVIKLPPADPKAYKLAAHFHEKLGRPDHEPMSKELDQATTLVADHGYHLAEYIVDYALEEAHKTNFKMRTFGAVFQYCQEALKSHEEEKKQRKLFEIQENKRKQESLKEEKQAKREWEALDRFYNSLAPKERERVDIIAEQRFRKFGLGTDPTSSFHKAFKQTAKHHVLRQYAREQGIEL
jgi:hypothetical protein